MSVRKFNYDSEMAVVETLPLCDDNVSPEEDKDISQPTRGTSKNQNDCVSLAKILYHLNEPIDEEQAWAVCHQSAQILRRHNNKYYDIEHLSDLLIHKDGRVVIPSVQQAAGSSRRESSEKKLISSLGVILYKALDYGFDENEENQLGPTLSSLIKRMTSADECGRDSCDEGIERDSGEDMNNLDSSLTLDRVIELCSDHLTAPEVSADNHYRAVCRALVAEALELSTFLSQITEGTKCLEIESKNTLNDLRVADWARIWMQVMRELRLGVKLKKVDFGAHELHPIEFEMTPFEMLLDDIRSQRYKLNTVIVDTNKYSNRVRKDAHAMILEFIRSRPPLVPASKRKLRPLPKREPTLYEKLMNSIKEKNHLRPIPTPPPAHRRSSIQLGRIKEDTSHSDDESSGGNLDSFGLRRCGSMPLKRVQSIRKLIRPDLNFRFDSESDSDEPPTSPDSPLSGEDENYNSLPGNNSRKESKRNDSLTLTLQELRHIRSAITKAELEGCCFTKELRRDLEHGKVCFTCLKTRFNLLNWGVKCKLCERQICEKCATKMDIPRNMLEKFDKIPVSMLIPTQPRKRSSSLTSESGKNKGDKSTADKTCHASRNTQNRDPFNLFDKVKKSSLFKEFDRVKLCTDCQSFIINSIKVSD